MSINFYFSSCGSEDRAVQEAMIFVELLTMIDEWDKIRIDVIGPQLWPGLEYVLIVNVSEHGPILQQLAALAGQAKRAPETDQQVYFTRG